MRRLLPFAVLAAFAMLPSTGFAQPMFEDPGELIEYAYAPYETGAFPEDPFELYSTNLLALVAADAERTPAGEVGALDFDPFIGAQDYEIADLAIAEPQVEGDRATVDVRFTNFGEQEDIVFTLVREEAGWKIDDIQSLSDEDPYVLSELLSAGAQ